MTKEEIADKHHLTMNSIGQLNCIMNAMQEYSNLQNKELTERVKELEGGLTLATKRLNQLLVGASLTNEQSYILIEEIREFNNLLTKHNGK